MNFFTEAAEWWNLAQNQALAASLGVGFYPGMIPPGFPGLGADAMNNKKLGSKESSRSSDHSQASNSRFSPHSKITRFSSIIFCSYKMYPNHLFTFFCKNLHLGLVLLGFRQTEYITVAEKGQMILISHRLKRGLIADTV